MTSCLLVAFFYFHQVSKTITEPDRRYLKLFLKSAALPLEASPALDTASFSENIQLIRDVQQTLLARNPPGSPIPQGQSRRPEDLYKFAGGGHCFDRAFTLAMLYRQLGMQTRHVALYYDDPARNDFGELLTRGTRSHAAIEVRTQRGWMIVDSNESFIGLNSDGLPLSYTGLSEADSSRWLTPISPELAWTVSGRATVVYGLYSRHGKAFPPYNFMPDLNWRELLHNL
ncbi:hypothetical protein CEQ90_06610 [Lewinellaceae bacterium SD302]|nr:hypothetical protein CEQ90_06610 [Lewinellaceae bacterium SD302]